MRQTPNNARRVYGTLPLGLYNDELGQHPWTCRFPSSTNWNETLYASQDTKRKVIA